MIIFDYLGDPRTVQKIVPGNTVTAIGAEIYEYIERSLEYTSGGTYVMAVGDTIVGATGSAVAVIIARTIASGTDAAGTAAGTLTLKCQVGAFQSENLNVEANANVATIAADSVKLPHLVQSFPKQRAKAALVSIEDNSINFTFDGTKPSQTYKAGHKLAASQSYVITNPDAIKNLKVVDAVAASAGTVKITCFF